MHETNRWDSTWLPPAGGPVHCVSSRLASSSTPELGVLSAFGRSASNAECRHKPQRTLSAPCVTRRGVPPTTLHPLYVVHLQNFLAENILHSILYWLCHLWGYFMKWGFDTIFAFLFLWLALNSHLLWIPGSISLHCLHWFANAILFLKSRKIKSHKWKRASAGAVYPFRGTYLTSAQSHIVVQIIRQLDW